MSNKSAALHHVRTRWKGPASVLETVIKALEAYKPIARANRIPTMNDLRAVRAKAERAGRFVVMSSTRELRVATAKEHAQIERTIKGGKSAA